MQELKNIQKELEKKARSLTWSRDVKTWDWKRLVLNKSEIKKLPLQNFKKMIRNITEIEQQGVVVRRLDQSTMALQKKVLTLLQNRTYPNRFSLYQQALGKSFFVIEIPAGEHVHLSLRNELFPYWATVFFVIGKQARVTVVDDHGPSQLHFGAAQLYILAGKHSEIEYLYTSDNLPSYAYDYEMVLEQGARVHLIGTHTLTATYYHHVARVQHARLESRGEITHIYDCQKSSRSWLFVENDHSKSQTTGDMVVKVLGRDRAWSRIDGWITIGKKGEFTDSYLQD